MAAIDLSLQTLQLEAVDEARGLSSLPPELIVHCCRFVTAADYASMSSACHAIRQALVQVDNKMWMAWAFERFRRVKLLMTVSSHVHARDEIDWKRLYKAQLAAEAVPPNQAVRLTSTVEDFTFNVQIARGPLATQEAGKVEFEWAGKIEGLDGSPVLLLWNEEEDPPLWLRKATATDHDLRIYLWVSKFVAHTPLTVCLMDGAKVDQMRSDDRDMHIAFEPTDAPDALRGKVDARDDALRVLIQQPVPLASFFVNPFIHKHGVLYDILMSHNDDDGFEEMTIEQVLMYLQQSVPWNSEP